MTHLPTHWTVRLITEVTTVLDQTFNWYRRIVVTFITQTSDTHSPVFINIQIICVVSLTIIFVLNILIHIFWVYLMLVYILTYVYLFTSLVILSYPYTVNSDGNTKYIRYMFSIVAFLAFGATITSFQHQFFFTVLTQS